MGYQRFMQALLQEEPIIVYGDGLQVRGNTYIDDCVEATVAAIHAPVGETYNLGGGEAASRSAESKIRSGVHCSS